MSNVDSLFAMIAGKHPNTKLILLVDKTENNHLENLTTRYANQVKLESLFHPIQQQLLNCL